MCARFRIFVMICIVKMSNLKAQHAIIVQKVFYLFLVDQSDVDLSDGICTVQCKFNWSVYQSNPTSYKNVIKRVSS